MTGKDASINRATLTDASAVADFLRAQDVRPVPAAADVAAFLARGDAFVACARRDGRLAAVAGFALDGHAAHMAYLALSDETGSSITCDLIECVAAAARQAGAALLLARVARGSAQQHALERCGFAPDWEEGETRDGRVVATVDLCRVL